MIVLLSRSCYCWYEDDQQRLVQDRITDYEGGKYPMILVQVNLGCDECSNKLRTEIMCNHGVYEIPVDAAGNRALQGWELNDSYYTVNPGISAPQVVTCSEACRTVRDARRRLASESSAGAIGEREPILRAQTSWKANVPTGLEERERCPTCLFYAGNCMCKELA